MDKRAESTRKTWLKPNIRRLRSDRISEAQLARSADISGITTRLWKDDEYRTKQKLSRAKHRAEAMKLWPRINCLHCNKERIICPCRINKVKFCDKSCQIAYNTGRPNLKNRGKTPSPRVGYGVSGRYKGKLFRSLHELSFMINVMEANNIVVEYETLRIPLENSRVYVPDFVSHDLKVIYEIKYEKALSQPNVAAKIAAGRAAAQKMGYLFEIYTEKRMALIDFDALVPLVISGLVTLHPRKNGGTVYNRMIKKLQSSTSLKSTFQFTGEG